MTMPIPRFFEPDPEIPDADLLGYGDIVYDDGSRRYVSNEPEVVAQLETPKFTEPPDLQPQGQVPVPELGGQQPQGPPAPQPIPGADGKMYTTDLMDPESPLKEIDPLAGNSMAMPAQAPMGPMGQQPQGGSLGLESVGAPVRPDGSSMQTPEQFDALMREPPPPIEGADGQLYMTDINDPENPIKPYDPNALQMVGREGALPPDVQQQQLGALGQAQQATLAANEQARADTARIQQEAFAQEMGANEARKQAIQQEQQEQTAKVQRWETERQQWAEMEVDKSLSGAQGTFGAALSVLGAALLSSTGSDVGLRMIENSITRHVQGQMQRRDSMLRIYAERIGDTQQAIKMARSEMYRITADRAELMTKKTANDVYEAQSPAIIAGLREKQTAEMNEAQRIGMGKAIERIPEPPKAPDRVSREGYGKMSADQALAERDTLRALNALGGKYDPKTGRITNRDELLKKGVPGVGGFDTFMKDIGRLPVVGALPQAADNAITSQEGKDLRAALESLVAAEAVKQNPGRAPTDADRDAARRSLGLESEKGVIDALERALNGFDQQRAAAVSIYGEPAAAAVEGTMQRQGNARQELTAPSQFQSLEPGRAREQIQRERARQRQPGTISEATPMEIENAAKSRAQEAGLNPDAIWRVIRSESGGKPGITNPDTNKHAGLIQFSRETWAGLSKEMGSDASWEDMRKMSAEEQLPFVMRYYEQLGLGPDNDAGDYKLATFFPLAFRQGWDDDHVIGRKGSRESIGGLSMGKIWLQNPGLRNGDVITVGDVRRSV